MACNFVYLYIQLNIHIHDKLPDFFYEAQHLVTNKNVGTY